jgi:hypothetical protein
MSGPGSAVAQAMRDNLLLYPAVEAVHIVGFVLLVGSVVMFDLRVLGLSRQVPVRALARHLLPWSVAALALIVPSGLVMFAAHADAFIDNPVFKIKMGLLLAAIVNAAMFHTGPYRGVAGWNTGVAAPGIARASAALSIALWFSIIACGRMLAHF